MHLMHGKQPLPASSVFILLVLVKVHHASVPPDEGAARPLNGTTIDLSDFPDYFVQVKVSMYAPGLHFKVKGPEGHGIAVVLRSSPFRKRHLFLDSFGMKCCELKVRSEGMTSNFYAYTSDDDRGCRFRGYQGFTVGVNRTLDIDVLLDEDDGLSLEQLRRMSSSAFILDITAISDCSNKTTQFQCSPTTCIPARLQCDGHFNCAYEDELTNDEPSLDELNCGTRKRESVDATTPRMPNSTTTPKPLKPYDVDWTWKADKTTPKPTWVIHYYDHGHGSGSGPGSGSDEPGWAQQVPLIGVLVIFLAVSLLLFGMCSFLARVNTRRHSATSGGTRRPDLSGIPNVYSIPAPEGRVYFYPDTENRAYVHAPPPAYHDPGISEAPPSYSALFNKNHSLHLHHPSSLVAAPPLPTIAVPPTFESQDPSIRR